MPTENQQRRRSRRRPGILRDRTNRVLLVLALLVAIGVLLRVVQAIGGGGEAASTTAGRRPAKHQSTATVAATRASVAHRHTPVLTAAASVSGLIGWTPAVTLGGLTAAALERVAAAGLPGASVTLLRLDQSLVRLQLHAGSIDPGGTWLHGAEVLGAERHRLLAAFNGGFKFSYASVGFELDGQTVHASVRGLASIVTYSDGRTDVGSWGVELPAAGRTVADVRQNGQLLIDHGVIAANVDSCVLACWGATVGSVLDTARSGLGITASGQLVWAGGEGLSVRALAEALRAAGALRAIELDVNPFWVAAYLYAHHGRLAAVPLVPGQVGVAGQLVNGPDARDYFTVLSR
jgi:hypothetical protein